ncbi:GNAT family N-acetyltransferase [Saccharibacillus sp. JS10]|uniref:GNAT family N-acetyltransferase n=1 Tax=Saccharibacillus sp. JS10 TaxID=2950552 RepID=UPI00210E004F|nr:GNAT family N-acetyltransferase [Saccharibacillus sp. JS10]MCQ4088329.1 GNAT family N-acetyltransferase [Saccharibacillus sp. JS10]
MTFYQWERADQEEFAVNQVIYSNTDLEMWYDWTGRLDDTEFTQDCFWIVKDGVRIGGIIKLGDTLIYPFIIPPFMDREQFWAGLLSDPNEQIMRINGVLQLDIAVLIRHGFQVQSTRKVMCCPTGGEQTFEIEEGLILQRLDETTNLHFVQKLLKSSYTGGIDYQTFGTPSEEEVLKDIQYVLDVYRHEPLSVYILDKNKSEIVGVCMAGIGEKMPLGFAEIADIAVLPAYRGKGIAEFMLRHVKAQARLHAPVVKLCVTVGNPAEALYQRVGFQSGEPFAKMTRIL